VNYDRSPIRAKLFRARHRVAFRLAFYKTLRKDTKSASAVTALRKTSRWSILAAMPWINRFLSPPARWKTPRFDGRKRNTRAGISGASRGYSPTDKSNRRRNNPPSPALLRHRAVSFALAQAKVASCIVLHVIDHSVN